MGGRSQRNHLGSLLGARLRYIARLVVAASTRLVWLKALGRVQRGNRIDQILPLSHALFQLQ